MRPRNKTEQLFVRLAAKLPPVTARQREWAYRHCFSGVASYLRHGRKIKCLCCGAETTWPKPFFDSFLDVDEYDCIDCDRSMRLVDKKTIPTLTERKFMNVITTFRGYQVIRTFEVCRDNYRNRNTVYSIHEIFQNWILDDGTEVITSRPYTRSAFCLAFNYNGDYSIKQHNASRSGYYQMEDLFDNCGVTLYPLIRVTPRVRRNGWCSRLTDYRNFIAMTDAIIWLLKCPTAEMLCKTGQFDLFLHMVREAKTELKFRHSVCIANRRGYIVRDASMWLDMLEMAEELHLDTHNPAIVCPDNLKRVHDRLLARVSRIHARKEAQERSREIAKEESRYIADKGQYFNIRLKDETGLTVSVIPSVSEIFEEGHTMHHCVYANKYHCKSDSLILSARDKDNNRLETVELSLKTFKVLQSRARFNKTTEYHKRIISLVETNSHIFKSCQTQ